MAESFIYSCPRCGAPYAFSSHMLQRVAHPETKHWCPTCDRPSTLREWRARLVRPFSVARDVTGF